MAFSRLLASGAASPLLHHVPELPVVQLVVPGLVKLLEGRLDLLLVQVAADLFELLEVKYIVLERKKIKKPPTARSILGDDKK